MTKSDNIGLFAYSITSLSTYGYTIDDVTLDLKKEDDYNNVETEYEKKFNSLGIKICRLKAHKDDQEKESQIINTFGFCFTYLVNYLPR